MARWQIARFANTTLFDPVLDEIEADPQLSHIFRYMYAYHFRHEGNFDQMYSSDFFLWIIQMIDAKLTGDYNSVNAQIRNYGKKPKKPQERSDIKSFKMFDGVIPERWSKALGLYEEQKRKEVKELKWENSAVIKMLKQAQK